MSRLREPFNAISHCVGMFLSLGGLVFLLWVAVSLLQLAVFAIYGLTLVLVYTLSTLYHGLRVPTPVRRLLGKLDRAGIYLFIAGSFTPVTVLILKGTLGWSLLALIWFLGGLGVFLLFVWPNCPRWFTTSMYLCMGWTGAFLVWPLLKRLPLAGVIWLSLGGIIYTLGALVYTLDWPRRLPGGLRPHGTWHILALLGSLSHFICIVEYMI